MASATFVARARTDGRDWLIEADEPLAGLQLRSGGELPGIVATPALLELVRKARRYGLKLARAIRAQDDREQVTAWVEVEPEADGGGCTIGIANWQATPLASDDRTAAEGRRASIERHLAELTARLDAQQEVLTVECDSAELEEIAAQLRQGRGRRWTELVHVEPQGEQREALHWRLLDGTRVEVPGSRRRWKAVLLPLGGPEPGQSGFDLLLVAEEPPADEPAGLASSKPRTTFSAAIGREIAPVLRQPIARIIANAETIRTQLAGPVAEEYSQYAADIASAGEHLLALIDDLADLEVVESEDFETAPDRIDLADVARRAAGITDRAAPNPSAGELPVTFAPDATLEPAGTSHFVIVDAQGDVVSMTTTVESVFGSGRMVGGFFLNNQLTDFSFSPTDDGRDGVGGRQASALVDVAADRARPRGPLRRRAGLAGRVVDPGL